ncbi:MAG: hypothetical protein AAGF11_45400 [Myxococcota bacterium]
MNTSIALPLERLADSVQQFVQRPEVRILHVATDGHLRAGALQILLAGEYLAQNRSPWIGLEIAGEAPDWEGLEPALCKAHRKMREARSPLAEITDEIAGRGAGRFAARLLQCVVSVRSPASGLVLMLVSAEPRLERSWLQQLQEMVFDRVLDAVRFVLVSTDEPAGWEWSEALPPERSLNHRCIVDPDAAGDELEREIEAEARHGPSDAGAGPSDAKPPTQKGIELPSLPPTDPKGRARPEEPAQSPEEPETVSLCVKRAVLAMQRKDGPRAIEQQARARDLCVRDGRSEDAVGMEMVLGGYMYELSQTEQAKASFGRAARMAAQIDAHGLQAQAHYAEAFIWQEEGQIDSAMRLHWAGIDAAKQGDEPRLAFDGYWEAGRALQKLDRRDSVVSLWTDAVSYANTLPPDKLRGTRMPEIARELVVVLKGMRRPADARAIEQWAEHTLGELEEKDAPNSSS